LDAIVLPKLWGVIKLETNLDALKNIGIDLKLAGVFQINTTKHDKVEKITLPGIPGDSFAEAAFDQTEANQLDNGTLPGGLQSLFTNTNSLTGSVQVLPIIPGSLWRLVDSASPSPRQFFIQVQDKTDLIDPNATRVLKFELRNDTQTFTLQADTLLIAAFAQAIFRLPPFTDAQHTQLGPEWFRGTGALQLKISTSSLQYFEEGVLTISPGGTKIFDLHYQATLDIELTGFAGKFVLGASVDLPGVHIGGQGEAYINTFGVDKDITPSPLLQPVMGTNLIVIFGKMPVLNTDYVTAPTTATTPLLVADNPSTPGAPYLALAFKADLNLANSLVLSGAFRIGVSTSSVAVDAFIDTSITIPGASSPLFELRGSANFGIDTDGVYGRVVLGFQAGLSADLTTGFSLTAGFLLEFNTASVGKTVQSFAIDTSTGSLGGTRDPTTGQVTGTVVNVSLAPQTIHLAAAGSLSFTADGSTALTLKGRFEFTLSPTMLQIVVDATFSAGSGGGLANATAAGAMQLSTSGLAGYITVSVGAGNLGSGQQDVSGTGFEIQFNLSVQINTGTSDVTIAGVVLAHQTVTIKASGFVQFSLGGVIGFRIDGSILVSGSPGNLTVQVNGVLTAKVAGATLLQLNASGSLTVTATGIAGSLTLTTDSSSIFGGNGFSFNASFELDVNTTAKSRALWPPVSMFARTRLGHWFLTLVPTPDSASPMASSTWKWAATAYLCAGGHGQHSQHQHGNGYHDQHRRFLDQQQYDQHRQHRSTH
jgi:hypothetical protein